MNSYKILQIIKDDDFAEIPNHGKWIESQSVIFAKEIRDNIFLLFVVNKDPQKDSVRAMIAKFDCIESISLKEPSQLMFYLTLQKSEDLHYFEKYMNITQLH
ncbi:hypothetical protein BA768_05505 [Chryseobacterium sp. CBo1]|uniref:hypothetical protein n=1 Tax=Chryseobacterium sp. CBo1 TaxID=1869230 RepID=UPI000810D57D|nr:hypothetical protein [Chryseobacterium sp. CBo1]OCK50091.1 hypothetical protein BA768_05505 [Chryseobacterium sp. CBo1]